MPFIFKRLALLTSIAMVLAPNKALPAKDEPKFVPGPAAAYQSHQTASKVTIGVAAYVSDQENRPVFGKNNPYNYGVLPVLVVIQNDSNKAIKVDPQVELMLPGGDRIDATPASDVRFLQGPKRPVVVPSPTSGGLGKILGKGKNPLDTWEIQGRAFSAKMLPPGQSASGFFYFQNGFQRGSTLYFSGLTEAETGQALLYFEIPLTEK